MSRFLYFKLNRDFYESYSLMIWCWKLNEDYGYLFYITLAQK